MTFDSLNYLVLSCFLLASKTLLAQSFMQGGYMENLMVIRVEITAPENQLELKITLKHRLQYLQASRNNFV